MSDANYNQPRIQLYDWVQLADSVGQVVGLTNDPDLVQVRFLSYDVPFAETPAFRVETRGLWVLGNGDVRLNRTLAARYLGTSEAFLSALRKNGWQDDAEQPWSIAELNRYLDAPRGKSRWPAEQVAQYVAATPVRAGHRDYIDPRASTRGTGGVLRRPNASGKRAQRRKKAK